MAITAALVKELRDLSGGGGRRGGEHECGEEEYESHRVILLVIRGG